MGQNVAILYFVSSLFYVGICFLYPTQSYVQYHGWNSGRRITQARKLSSQSIYTPEYRDITRSSSSRNPSTELDLKEIQRAYDGDKISQYYSKRFLVVWERLVQIGSPIIGWWILRKVENITAPFRSSADNQRLLNLRAADLKNSIVQGKSVTFIKSGQALALRPDIVKSPEYIRELQKLQDEVGTFDNNIAMQIIADELGAPAEEIYDFNPPIPIASASIGQVYKARLRSSNMSVAVKVQVKELKYKQSLFLIVCIFLPFLETRRD